MPRPALVNHRLKAAELARFLRTDQSLEGRRSVYRNPHIEIAEADLIAAIKKAIINGDTSQKAIVKAVRDDLEVSPSAVIDFLRSRQGILWDYKKGYKTTRVCYLMELL